MASRSGLWRRLSRETVRAYAALTKRNGFMVEDLSAENGAIRSRFPAGMETNSSRQTEPAELGPCGEPFLDSASAAGGGHLRLCEAGIESFGQWLVVANGRERPVLRFCEAAIVDG